ncbi:hypothetical protein FQN49_005944, partial [Arthroderma sp. PD_2]
MNTESVKPRLPCLQQLFLSQSDPLQLITPDNVDPKVHERERAALKNGLLDRCPREAWSHDYYTFGSPHPILINKGHDIQLQRLHEALVLAVTNIVERWWTDSDANFPARMPLEPQEESLLRWIETDAADSFRPIKRCLGSWRPDFLIEEACSHLDGDPATAENFRICEINARFSFSGFLIGAYGQDAIFGNEEHDGKFVKAAEPER